MSLLFMDGFDAHGSTANLTRKWRQNTDPANVQWNATAGKSGGGALVVTSAALIQTPSIASAVNGMSAAFWLKVSAAPAANNSIAYKNSDDKSVYSALAVSTAGMIGTQQGGKGYLFSSTNVADNAWHWIEWRTVLSGAEGQNGTEIIYVDGVLAYSATNYNGSQGNTLSTTLLVLSGLPSRTVTFDDVVVWNNSGSNWNWTTHWPIGPQNIQTIYPTGAGTTTQFTPNTGANWDAVNDVSPDDDTTYVQDSVTGHRDLYTLADLTGSPSTVKAVAWNVVSQNPGAGAIPQKPVAKSGATTSVGSAATLTVNYGVRQTIYEKDVAAGTPDWTPTTVNALELGYEIG